MSILTAIIIGIVQGLSEFIPISSSAHMTIFAQLFGVLDTMSSENWTAFMAVVQLGTLFAVFVYFAKDIQHITTVFFHENVRERKAFKEQSADARMGWNVIVGSVPIVVLGLGLKKLIEGDATKSMTLIAIMLLVVSALMILAERIAKQKRTMSELTLRDAVIIGCSQALALMPGASRSGTTIAAGMFLGMQRETAARFSFLLSIPAIAGSGLLQFVKSVKDLNNADWLALVVATLIAGLTGYWAISFLMKYLRTHTVTAFVVYRVALALALLLFYRVS